VFLRWKDGWGGREGKASAASSKGEKRLWTDPVEGAGRGGRAAERRGGEGYRPLRGEGGEGFLLAKVENPSEEEERGKRAALEKKRRGSISSATQEGGSSDIESNEEERRGGKVS